MVFSRPKNRIVTEKINARNVLTLASRLRPRSDEGTLAAIISVVTSVTVK
jgi:hypothetical protein